mgnify:CR=1 FL=1
MVMHSLDGYSMSRKKKVRFILKDIVKRAAKNKLCSKDLVMAAEDIELEREPEKEVEIFSLAKNPGICRNT